MSKATEHLDYLVGVLGPRPLGGESNLKAAEYAERALSAAGFKTERQNFSCMSWKEGSARLEIDGKRINTRPAQYSSPVEAQCALFCVGSREKLMKSELCGKIAVLRGEWTKQPLSPKNNPFWYPDEDREVIERLEASGAKALLISCEGEAMIDDGAFAIPCALISPSDASALKDGMLAKLHMDCVRGTAEAFNVIATLGDAAKRVCISAHLDTKGGAPGALDDGAGASAVLALAEKLSGVKLPFAVEIALFSGEDNYANDGEVLFMNTRLSDANDYLYNINVDGIGMPDCDTTAAFFDTPPRLKDAAQSLMSEGWSEMEPWPQGDHSMFVMCGIPAIALTSKNIFFAPLHTPEDKLSALDMNKVDQTVEFLYKLLLSQR